MSEEKPTFKITDRRLFNPDGSPREGAPAPEPTPAPEAATETAPENIGAGGATSSADSDAAQPAAAGASEASAASSGAARQGRPTGEAATEPRAGGVREESGAASFAPDEDPQEFLMVVEFIASFAADALGMVNHPSAAGREVNLPLAKQCIDMLGTLQRKTRGNLSPEEQQFFELVLSQLRMQYVSLTGGSRGGPQAPRGFTGGDITGGR
ncbi:MAG TPA: DUF1844 domain-containing protein [Pyrinomonadaceae bacterium]|jgi:hypothetical protein|nr:DUF1844 domain-containing protein [Pyrinomonadaceae bacterium]